MKILFIACYSPFINNSAAIETLQYLNKLAEIEGNQIHLLTVDFPENSIYYDKALSELMDKKIKVHLIGGGKLFNKLVPRKTNSNIQQNSNIRKTKLLRKIKNALVIPDMYYNWSKASSEEGIKIMTEENIDVIFSMHEPPSSHLCAYNIKKKFKDVPWITYWSDPWLKDSTREGANWAKKSIEASMEKKVVQLADKFIFVTEANRTDYVKSYNIDYDSTHIITRGFDADFYEKLSKEDVPPLIKKDKINILYAGEIFSKLRDIGPFVDAIYDIRENNKELYSKMNILFFGNIDDVLVKQKLQELEIAHVEGRIPFNEAIKYMLHSEILLLFGNKNSKQIPAKIYEYLGACGKVFTIYGDNNDPIRTIVDDNSKCITSNNEKDEIKEKLSTLVSMNKEMLLSPPDNRYEWSSIIGRLNKILEV